jgi:hypothetical protein
MRPAAWADAPTDGLRSKAGGLAAVNVRRALGLSVRVESGERSAQPSCRGPSPSLGYNLGREPDLAAEPKPEMLDVSACLDAVCASR